MPRLPLRFRVTVASAASIALILGALSFFVYARLQAELVRASDAGLRARAEAIASGMGQHDPSGFDPPDGRAGGLTQVLTPAGQLQASSGSRAPSLSPAELRMIRGPEVVSLAAAGG